jgi:hypothetical protein
LVWDRRSLLTYPEFQQLREQSTEFSGLMACQSQLERTQVRVDGAEPEEIRYRMVSAEYFSTLGVPALLGRTFDAYDTPASPYAVISYAYWQPRFGRRADILGTRMAVRQAVFSIIGIAPASFFGETVGERHPQSSGRAAQYCNGHDPPRNGVAAGFWASLWAPSVSAAGL